MKTGYCPKCDTLIFFGEAPAANCPGCLYHVQKDKANQHGVTAKTKLVHGVVPPKSYHALTIRCPLPLYAELKKYSIRYNLSMQKTVERMLERGLKNRKDFDNES